MFNVFQPFCVFRLFATQRTDTLVGDPIEFRTADGLYFRTADGVYFGVPS